MSLAISPSLCVPDESWMMIYLGLKTLLILRQGYLARVLKLYMSHYTTVVVGRYWYLNGRVLDTGSICTCMFWY